MHKIILLKNILNLRFRTVRTVHLEKFVLFIVMHTKGIFEHFKSELGLNLFCYFLENVIFTELICFTNFGLRLN